mmetsp:Transcript_120275/g.208780  ORF Transcript_120275/g.208780 Transcript_120275/m.208780 type:complete len:93 (-) Transcript_120275:143-421(-)
MSSQASDIVEAFRKYDPTGQGTITCENLGKVLQSLAPDMWSEESLDEFISIADKNADGKVEYEDFVSWVWEEEEEVEASILSSVSTKFGRKR